jgi:ribosomal protein L18E
LHSGHVLAAGIMAGIADMAHSISRLIPLEVAEGLGTPSRQRAPIAVMRIEPVVDVPIETSWTVEPGTRPNE